MISNEASEELTIFYPTHFFFKKKLSRQTHLKNQPKAVVHCINHQGISNQSVSRIMLSFPFCNQIIQKKKIL